MRLAAGSGEGNACEAGERRLIDWVDHALDRWGHWAARTEARAIGFPRYSPSCRADRSDGWGDGRLPSDLTDDDMEAITRAIDALPMRPGRPFRNIVLLRYRARWPYRRIAGYFAMPHQTCRDRMHEAHTLIARALEPAANPCETLK